jgi:hypothetical protein
MVLLKLVTEIVNIRSRPWISSFTTKQSLCIDFIDDVEIVHHGCSHMFGSDEPVILVKGDLKMFFTGVAEEVRVVEVV